ncbi:MAG: hypothetical protein HN368_00815 [Spirochaetales bacterium]|nr:hypothetical protein [Spirochaetales bacterium]
MKIRIARKKTTIVMFAMPDIAFLLLIFLILTVSVAEDEEIAVPNFQFIQETDFPDVVAIRVGPEGSIEISGVEYNSEELETRLESVEPGYVIHLIADRNADYVFVDRVLGALKKTGLQDVILIAETDDNL